MNKSEFTDYISKKYDISRMEAEKVINIFTSSVTSALGEGSEIQLVGFGAFFVSKREARTGRNPRTGAAIKIEAYNQPSFKVGKSLKDACNVVT
ncbi:MAG: HU family DNA-binding protein [Pseudomonadota bacterium]